MLHSSEQKRKTNLYIHYHRNYAKYGYEWFDTQEVCEIYRDMLQ